MKGQLRSLFVLMLLLLVAGAVASVGGASPTPGARTAGAVAVPGAGHPWRPGVRPGRFVAGRPHLAGTPVACGNVISVDTTLSSDLHCLGDGLVVQAGVTLDLGGHTLGGSGSGFGIFVEAEGVTIENGTVTGFGVGVQLNSVPYFASGLTMKNMTVSRNSGDGVYLQVYNRGIQIINCTITRNGGNGIAADYGDDGSLFQGNQVTRNGEHGLRIYFATGRLIDNQAERNGADGIQVSDYDSFAPFYHLKGNRADRNALLGIEVVLYTAFPSGPFLVDDQGGNSASGNGNPLQCVGPGLTCTSHP